MFVKNVSPREGQHPIRSNLVRFGNINLPSSLILFNHLIQNTILKRSGRMMVWWNNLHIFSQACISSKQAIFILISIRNIYIYATEKSDLVDEKVKDLL